jgi:hypothetical protein
MTSHVPISDPLLTTQWPDLQLAGAPRPPLNFIAEQEISTLTTDTLWLGSPATAHLTATHKCSQIWRWIHPKRHRDSVECVAALVPLCRQAMPKAEKTFSGDNEGHLPSASGPAHWRQHPFGRLPDPWGASGGGCRSIIFPGSALWHASI